MILSERLSELRKQKNVSKKDLSFELGLEQSTYGKYELGQRQPSIEILRKLSEYFDVSVDYLLGITNIPNSTEKNTLTLNEAAGVLQNKLAQMDIDIEEHNELEVVLGFIDSNKDMLKLLMNKNSESKNVDNHSTLQFVAKGGDGVQTITVSESDRAKSLEALEKLKDDK